MHDLKQTENSLKDAEARISKLHAERLRLEGKISGMRSPADDFLLYQTREELKSLNEQIETVQLEACGLRVALKESELPAARAAIEPLRKDFDAAMARYSAARVEADAA